MHWKIQYPSQPTVAHLGMCIATKIGLRRCEILALHMLASSL
jgi:hypothetical protein